MPRYLAGTLYSDRRYWAFQGINFHCQDALRREISGHDQRPRTFMFVHVIFWRSGLVSCRNFGSACIICTQVTNFELFGNWFCTGCYLSYTRSFLVDQGWGLPSAVSLNLFNSSDFQYLQFWHIVLEGHWIEPVLFFVIMITSLVYSRNRFEEWFIIYGR